MKISNFKFQIDLVIILILSLGAFFRFYGLNWDQNFHLHPDERFLTMVGNAMKLPNNVFSYFDPQISTFNPTNIGYQFFVYGTFPIVLNKILAVIFGNDNYNSFTLQGRLLSGFFDLLIILLIYKTVQLFEKHHKLNNTIKYWASFFYAIAVLPIQLSHFFAVDTFLNFFMFASFYFALKFSFEQKRRYISLSAIFLGLAFASKVSAIFIFPLLLFLILKNAIARKKILLAFGFFLAYGIITYIALRMTDPYMFQRVSFFDPTINETFLSNLKTLKNFEGKDIWYPPGIQWIEKPPIIFSVTNLALFGVGIPYFLFICVGMYWIIRKSKNIIFYSVLLWVALFFLFQSTQFVKAMRYIIFLYPFFAIFAGIGFDIMTRNWKKEHVVFALVLIFIWPLSFFSIYTKDHTRIVASKWMYQNVENNSLLLGEHWDDMLPLSVENRTNKFFITEQLEVFGQDTPEKWQKIDSQLQRGNYLIFSSNRGWGSMPTVPEKYPQMSKFYDDLFNDRTSYKKIKEFTSYPSLTYLGIPITFSDDFAEEAFTVYDHPKVMIFKKQE